MTTENEKEQPQKAYGLLAEYKNTTELVNAATKVRDAGYTKWDCYSPFPVHGIDPAMGIKATKTPWLILMMGITGLTVGLVMQYYMNAYDYKYLISGKPFFSLPANVPVMFELTVLFSGLTAIFGTLAINNLPSFYHPLFKVKEFARATDDRYFVAIEAGDNRYDADRTKAFLIETGAATVQEVEDDSEVNAGLPMPIIYIGLCAFVIGFIPLSHIFNARFAKMDTPRIHPNPGMDFQPKFKAQTENDLFADGRSMRAPIEGTVRIGEERIDDHFYEGVIDGEWAEASRSKSKSRQHLLNAVSSDTKSSARTAMVQQAMAMASSRDGLTASSKVLGSHRVIFIRTISVSSLVESFSTLSATVSAI